MLAAISTSSRQPLADQIAAQVRAALARGELSPGDRLPAARELAAGLGVNMHTVLRAYGALRDEGVLDLRRGRGAVVAAGVDPARVQLREMAEALVREARRLGVAPGELETLLREVPG